MNKITFSRRALKDIEKIKTVPALRDKVLSLITVLEADPFQNPPPYEKLSGDLKGFYSRRINIQHRLVYEALEGEVKILSLWSHYE